METEKTIPDITEKIPDYPNLQRGGPGRKAGLPNKATARAREAIAEFVDGNADRLVGWLDAIAEKDPEAAFQAFMSVVEYHIPKLARTEIKQDIDLNAEVTVRKYEFHEVGKSS